MEYLKIILKVRQKKKKEQRWNTYKTNSKVVGLNPTTDNYSKYKWSTH